MTKYSDRSLQKLIKILMLILDKIYLRYSFIYYQYKVVFRPSGFQFVDLIITELKNHKTC